MIIAICLLAPLPFKAQDAGAVAGKVVDAKNVPIPGATVRLISKDTGSAMETLTEVDGSFSFSSLTAGSYQLQVEMGGFEKVSRENISLGTGSGRLTLVLRRPGPPRGSAPVSGSSPVPPAQRPARAVTPGQRPGAAADAFQEVPIEPIPGADVARPNAPGTEMPRTGDVPREEDPELLVINGNSSANIGAGDWNDPNFRSQMMDMAGRMGFALGEGQGRPDGPGGPGQGRMGGPMGGGMGGGGGAGGGGFGPGGGGGRGGFRMGQQSRFTGSVYSTYQNSFFNARNYSLTGNELDKPVQITNNFGASIGGNLPWKPKINQSRAAPGGGRGGGPGGGRFAQAGMWFVSYDGTRNRSPYEILTTVPTLLERQGDFSRTVMHSGPFAGQPIKIFDLLAAKPTPFADNQIPASRMNPAALGLLKFIPPPNLPGSIQNYALERALPTNSDGISIRVNSPISAKDNVFVNYALRRSDSLSSQIFPGLDTGRTNRSQNIGLGGMHRFQPRLILNYRVSFNRVRTFASNPFSFTNDAAGQLGITGISRDPINYGIPTVTFTNYGSLSLGNPSLTRTQTLTLGGGLSKIGSKHSIQAGGDINWNQRNSRVDPNARGTFDFTGFATSAFDAGGHPIAGTGYDFADFLLGLPNSTSRRFGSSNNYLRNKNFNIFVQDNWRVRSNLTVNAGLRYEYIQPFYEKYNHIVTLDVAPDFTAVAPVFPDQTGPYSGYFPRSLIYSDKNNFGPRVGIAWKPKPSSTWVFRAGYGLFYNPSVYPAIVGQLVGQPPFAVSQNLLTSASAPLTLQNGFPADPSVTIRNSYAIDPNYKIGYVQSWNLNIQTQVFKIYTIEAGYNGSKGTRLDILRAPNRAPLGSSPVNTEDNRIISNAESFLYQSSGANSILHSMAVRVSRRFSHGFRMVSAYTLAKSIDNASGVGGGSLLVVQDDHNIYAERSLSSFDQRHRFSTDFNVELPMGENRRFFANAGPFMQRLISGWNLNGTYQLASGAPLTARILGNVSNNSGTGSNSSERADSTGQVISLPGGDRTTMRFFDTLAFAIPGPGLFGNAGRNTIPGPGSNLLNLSLRKNFRIGDNSMRRLEFQCQVTNLLNHPNFGGVATVVNALNFGRVTSVGTMRRMTFNLRLNF